MEIDDVVIKVLSATGFSPTDMASDKRTRITVFSLFKALILFKTREAAASSLGITKSKLEYILQTRISSLIPKAKQAQWHVHLLSLVGLRRCFDCEEIKELSEFINSAAKFDGVTGLCKSCASLRSKQFKEDNPEYSREYRQAHPAQHREYCATYKASKIGATPPWADLNKIKEIYNNCPEGMHVDHIVPLRGKNVCGFHVENNLQYLTPEENTRKSNRFD